MLKSKVQQAASLIKDNIVAVRNEGKVTLFAVFIVKPSNTLVENATNEDANIIFPFKNNDSSFKITLYRYIVPGSLRKKDNKNKPKTANNRKNNSLIVRPSETRKKVIISFFLYQVAKTYNLRELFLTPTEMIEDFNSMLKTEVKETLYSIGKVGRLAGQPLLELVVENKVPDDAFIIRSKNSFTFTEVGKDFGLIIPENKWKFFIKAGPSVDIRPNFLYSYPTGIKSSITLGITFNGQVAGLPESPSFPILIAGDKKTREITIEKLALNSKVTVVLDPRANLEFDAHLPKNPKFLLLGKNFTFNVLDPFEQKNKEAFELHISNLIEIIKSISDARFDTIIWLKDIVEYYLHEYHDSQELLSNSKPVSVTLNDLYAMITTEPGGLILSDFQLSAIRALLSEIRDDSIANNSSIQWTELLDESIIIDFSHQSFKIQRLFLYAFLSFLSLYPEDLSEVLMVIDDAELFFSYRKDALFFVHLFKELIRKGVKVVFSTAFPSQIDRAIFDLNQNKIIGTLRSGKCVELIAQQHSLHAHKDFLYRLPKNSFLLFREDLADKPLLLKFTDEDLERHLEQSIVYKAHKSKPPKQSPTKVVESEILDPKVLVHLHPIMHAILQKLDQKLKRGINTVSLPKLFPQWPEYKVKEAILLLEKFGYIYHENVDAKGKGEAWWRITPKGKQFLIELGELILTESIRKELAESEEQPLDSGKEETDVNSENNEIVKTEETTSLISDTSDFVQNLLNIRAKVRMLRDNQEKIERKLILLHEYLKELKEIKIAHTSEQFEQLIAFEQSLKDLLEQNSDFSTITSDIVSGIFRKALSLIDLVYSDYRYKIKQSQLNDQQFIEKLLEKEFTESKWEHFESPVQKMANEEQIQALLTSTYPEEVIKGLEFSINASDEDFIRNTQQAIASLIQTKLEFWPNIEPDIYLNIIRNFFLVNDMLEPFERSRELLWEYSVFRDEIQDTVKKAQKRREIIQLIQTENESFEIELKPEEKQELMKEIIEKTRRRKDDD